MTPYDRACEPRDGRSMVRQKQHGKRRPVLGVLDPNRGLLQLRKEAKRSHDRAVPGLVPWKRAWKRNVSLGAGSLDRFSAPQYSCVRRSVFQYINYVLIVAHGYLG
jgi:hypothetical protein